TRRATRHARLPEAHSTTKRRQSGQLLLGWSRMQAKPAGLGNKGRPGYLRVMGPELYKSSTNPRTGQPRKVRTGCVREKSLPWQSEGFRRNKGQIMEGCEEEKGETVEIQVVRLMRRSCAV